MSDEIPETYRLYRMVEQHIEFDAFTDEEAKGVARALSSGQVKLSSGKTWFESSDRLIRLEQAVYEETEAADWKEVDQRLVVDYTAESGTSHGKGV